MWIARFHSHIITKDFDTFVCDKNAYSLAVELTDSWCKDNEIEPSYDLNWEK